MGSEMDQQPCKEAASRPSATPASRPRFIMEYGGPVMDFRYARNDVMDRLDAARAAGNVEEVGQLEEEAEVLWWKMCRAIKPDREVPAAILERFDNYPDHPHLPDNCPAGGGKERHMNNAQEAVPRSDRYG